MKQVMIILILLLSGSVGADTLNAQWIQQKSGTDAMLSDVVMLDTSTAIAVGRNGSILRTTNSGSTWFDVAAALSYIGPWNAVSFYDTLNGIVVGDHGVVLTTTNGGKSWIWHQVPGARTCHSALYTGPNSVYVGADSGWVYNSTDAGRSWGSEKLSSWPVRTLFQYRGPGLLGVSKYALTPYSICTQYVIPPPSWSEKILPDFHGLGSEGYHAEYCNGGGAGFIVGVQGDFRAAPTILRKSVTDTSWRNATSGIAQDGRLLGVSAPSASVIYVCGDGGMVYRSSNGGDTWIKENVPARRQMNAIFFYDETRGFAVGDSGLILYRSGSKVTGVGDHGGLKPVGFMLEQNYPNPFNPSTAISFQLSAVSLVNLRVFDLLGREVATIVEGRMEAGRHSVTWNASAFSSGVYFCRLQAGGFVEGRKLVLLR